MYVKELEFVITRKDHLKAAITWNRDVEHVQLDTRCYVRTYDLQSAHTVAILHVQKSRMCIIAHCTLEQLTTMKLLDSATNQTEWEGVHLPVWLMHQVRGTEPTYIYLKNTIDNFSPIYEFVLN